MSIYYASALDVGVIVFKDGRQMTPDEVLHDLQSIDAMQDEIRELQCDLDDAREDRDTE